MNAHASNFTGHRSRKRISPFRLHRPVDLSSAVQTWKDLNRKAALLAGGVDLINSMKEGADYSDVIDLRYIGALKAIERHDQFVHVGPMVTHSEFASASLPASLALFGKMWGMIANPRIRHKGTLGGNIMARNSSYDLLPCLCAFDATLFGMLMDGREISIAPATQNIPEKFFLLGIRLPLEQFIFAFDRTEKPSVSLALAATTLDDHVTKVGVGVGCAYDVVLGRTLTLPRPLSIGEFRKNASRLASQIALALPRISNQRASTSSYRHNLMEILIKRSIERAGAGDDEPDA